jgi:nicotinate phosphoribosyltransferase
MKMVAGPSVKCIEFGLRRAQGPNGANLASKYSYVGGFDGTSNVYAAYLNNSIPVLGTQAHSFIMSFEGEEDIEKCRHLDNVDLLEKALAYRTELGWNNTVLNELYAFVAYAVSYPATYNALVDSYSTKTSGCLNFIVVALALADLGY